MRAYVFPDRALMPVAAQFVWLSIDAENAKNAGFLAKFPVDGFPTLLVLDPQREAPTRTWMGSYTAPELASRLSEVAHAMAHDQGSTAQRALAAGAAALTAGNEDEAQRDFQEALRRSPDGTLTHAQAVEGLLGVLQAKKLAHACVTLAEHELPTLAPGTSLANAAASGLACAEALPPDDPDRTRALDATTRRVESLASDRSVVMLADDRSGLYETLVEAEKARGADAAARRAAQQWSDFLEGQAAAAPTPQARAVFDAHRLLAYLELGEVQKAIPMLQASERDLPDDYNPPARLAVAYLKLGQPAQALAQAERAQRLVYGPRTVRVLLTKADALAALGRRADVEKTLAQAQAVARQSTGTQAERLQAAIQARRDAYVRKGLL